MGATVTFVTATAAGAVLHLDMEATRRLVRTQADSILEGQLRGKVVVERLAGLGLGGIEGARVRVLDPHGVQVLFVDGVTVRVRALDAARSALFGDGPIGVRIEKVEIDHVDAALDADPDGGLRIAHAFEPREKAPAEPAQQGGRGVRIEAPELVLHHAWAHGVPSEGAPLVDAEVKDLAAHALIDPSETRAVLERVDLVTRGLPSGVDPRGRITARFRQPAGEGAKPAVDGSFDGAVLGVPTRLVASMDGDRVDATVDAHADSAARAFAALGELPLRDALTVHAEAHGTLPRVAAEARVAVGDATVTANADVTTGDVTTIDGRVAARDIDLARISEGAPRTSLGLDASGRVALGDELRARATIDTLPGVVDGQSVPPAHVRATYAGDSAEAELRIEHPSMPTDAHVVMTTTEDDRVVVADVRSVVPDLRRIPKAAGVLDRGSAELRGHARVSIEHETVDGRVALTATDVAMGEQSLAAVHAEARAAGTLERPLVDAAVRARGVRAGGIDARTVQARARVRPGRALVVEGARIDVDRGDDRLSAGAARIESEGARIRVDGAFVEGLGEPIRADVERTPGKATVRIAAPRIDLAKASRLAGRDLGIESGSLALGADVVLDGAETRGRMQARLSSFSMGEIERGEVSLDAAIDGRDLALDLDARLDSAGKLALRSKRITLGGSASEPEAWAKASGRIALEGDVDMSRIASVVPKDALPFGELDGELVVTGTLGRDSASAPPEIRLHAHTLGLVAAGKAPPEAPIAEGAARTEVHGVAPWRSDDVDIGIDVRNDTTSGLTDVAFRLTDREGLVTAFDAKSIVPYAEILAAPRTAKQRLLRVPVEARLVVPRREMSRMPSVVGAGELAGSVEAQLDVSGTPLEPRAVFVAHARGMRTSEVAVARAADADVRLTYDGARAELTGTVDAEGRRVVTLGSRVDLRARDFLEPAPGTTPDWGAGAKVELAAFRLESLGPLASRRIAGKVSGTVALDGLNRDARLSTRIGFEGLRVGGATYRDARIEVDAKDDRLSAKARFDQDDGFAELTAGTGLTWGAALAPALEEDHPIEARLVAKSFRAAVVQPFVEGTLNAVDGRIDADAKATLVPSKKDARFEGRIALRDGTLQIPALGEQLSSARATIALRPDGSISVDDVFAKSANGEVHADAKAKLAGLALESAKANLRIPEDHAFDVAMNGQPLGQVFGNASMSARATDGGKDLAVVVEVPKFHVALPQTTKSGVQSLDESEKVRVGVYRDDKTFAKLPLDKEDFEKKSKAEEKAAAAAEGSRTDVDVRIGRIEVVRGNMARVALTGNPKIVMAGGQTVLDGEIRVVEGWVDVQGKKFDVERATVTFTGQPEPNPIVMATATWKAEDDTQVFADFTGPVKTGKVTLRSEPPRPKNEILSLILFGTADGANPTPPPAGKQPNGTQKAALGIGGGFAAQGLTEALDDLSGIEATARIDTTSSNNPRPEVEFQVSPRVSLEFAHVIGQPPVTEPPDKNLVTVDWRFKSNWSLESTFGDRGRQLYDLIWEKRY